MAMVLPSSFRERLHRMEATRNQRLSLLQAEKEVQATKSVLLSSKLSGVRSREQRCLMLDRKIASQGFKISSLKSEIISLDAEYQNYAQQWRVLKSEVEVLEELEREKDRYYDLKSLEMEEFRSMVDSFTVDCRAQVRELGDRVKELKSNLHGNTGNSSNLIAAAERRRFELLDAKDNLDRSLVSNYQVRSQLQRQLQNVLVMQQQQGRKESPFDNSRK